MASCVPSEEQNDLVVRTELRLRRLNTKHRLGKTTFWIGDIDTCVKLRDSMSKLVYQLSSENEITQSFFRKSILDIPKQYRTDNSVIICFDEPSYSGRQCLYHLFGEKLGLTPYQTFVEVMEKTQENGDAIVFTQEEIMWFPGPKPEFSAQDIYKFADIAFTLDVPLMGVYNLKDIPEPIQTWVLKTYPQTKYVNIQMINGKDHEYHMWGWNHDRFGSSGSQKADWWQPIKGIKKSDVVISPLVGLKKQADEFNKKYSTSLEEQLVIVCAPTAKYFSDWVNMAEKLIQRLEEEKVYPSILIPGVGNTQHRLTYSYAGRKWNFDIEQEWNSSIVFAWLMEKCKEAGKHGLTQPKTEAAALQETINSIEPSLKIQEEPDMKAQVAALTETVKALTEVVAKLAAK
jgi:hypothetical protein